TNIDYIDDAFSGKNKPLMDNKYDVDPAEKLGTIEIDIQSYNDKQNVDIKVGFQTNKGASGAGNFNSNEEAYEYYMHLAENLDVSTERNATTFYSGKGNRVLAEEFANINGKTTLEMTQGGKYLDELKLFEDGSPLTKEQSTDVWKRLSERYAENASGTSFGFTEGAWEGSIFNTIEYPTLVKNPNINNVISELLKKGDK
ncbi:hypothetical protein, partial [Clostridium sp.]